MRAARPTRHFVQQDGADQAHDGLFARKDADYVAAPFDFAVQALSGIGGVDRGAMLGGEAHLVYSAGLIAVASVPRRCSTGLCPWAWCRSCG